MADEHPLALELSSLKTALDKYQAGHAAHISSLQLQRAHLEASDTYAHSKLLEAENTRLKEELTVLRDNPEPTHAPREVTELTLALRRVSDKLSHTESILLQRTTELAQAISEKMGMQLEANASRAEADRIRQAEFECRSRERELTRKCKAAEEEARMADAVVMEYADLVRSMEGRMPKAQDIPEGADDGPSRVRSPSPSSPQTRSKTILRSLTENRYSLQRLLYEFNSETSDLQAEITRLHAELSAVLNKLDSEREISRQDRSKLAEALVEVERCKIDDTAAGKLVSRYMRFSQSSIDILQTALSNVKSRHAMTLATVSSSNEALSQALALERTRAAQLRDILDQLTEDISRETFGRRREVALRLRSVVREEKMSGALSIWLRRAEEHRGAMSTTMEPSSSNSSSELSATLDRMIEDAHALRASLSHSDYPVTNSLECASWERVVFAEHTCRSLLSELQEETEKRLALTRTIGEKFHVSQSTSQQNIADPGKKPDQPDQVTIPSEPKLSEVPRTPSLDLENDTASSPIPPPQTTEQPQYHDDASGGEQKEHGNVSAQAEDGDDIGRPRSARDRPEQASSIEETNILAHPPVQLLSDEQQSRPPSPLIDELTVSRRYEQLQRAFRDCHLALGHLKTAELSSHADKSTLSNVVYRLDDFCEDARVELEIRMADEERIIQGFETMLRVPGALAVANGADARRELQSFVDGTALAVTKAHEAFTIKVADLQHDIAQVKRALHELDARPEAQLQPATETPPIWTSWTPFLSTPPKRASSPAPTFGTVITTPRSNRTSTFSSRPSPEATLTVSDPYAYLDLRIPMPSQTRPNLSLLESPSKLRNSESSRMYLLGLGGSNGGLVSTPDLITEAKQSLRSEYDSDPRDNHSDVE
ncbi:hypothetical protein JB92DRAFT_2818166 [Gautieria morchelliformis]|nr:hypothetical protein JB92DRAFT_2818166 [Gautieria morchelliformis]